MMDRALTKFVKPLLSVPKKRFYYVVVKPFDEGYKNYEPWFRSFKFNQNVERALLKLDPELQFICVKEKCAAKYHLNFLCHTSVNLTDHHDKNKYLTRWHVQELDNVNVIETHKNCERVCEYMFKESKDRRFVENNDFHYKYTVSDEDKVDFAKYCHEQFQCSCDLNPDDVDTQSYGSSLS